MFGKLPGLSRFVGVALVLGLAATLGFSQENDETPAFNTVLYSDKSWIEYKPTGGRFSVLLPGAPAESIQTIDSALGKKKLHMSLLMVQIDESLAVCLTAYSDFPLSFTDEGEIRKIINSGRDELFLAKPSRKLISEKDIHLDSYIGRELTFEDGGLLMIQRMFLVNERFYQMTVGVPKESKLELLDNVRQKIFSSYKILAAPHKNSK